MCGLVGLAGDLRYADEGLMRRLMWFSAMQRGDDAAGMGIVRISGETTVAKCVGFPTELFENTRFRAAFNGNMSKVFLGHTRRATYGDKSRMNAHPFEYGSIIGAHNGTLDRDCVEEIGKELDEKFTVDSQALIAAIAAWGPKEALSKIRGAWSIVWYDKDDDTLNFLRNGDRPMVVAWAEDRKTLMWASEAWMLEMSTELVTPERKRYVNTKGNDVWFHEENLHYVYPLRDILNPPKKGLFKPTVRKVEGAPAKAIVPFTQNRGRETGYRDPFTRGGTQPKIGFGANISKNGSQETSSNNRSSLSTTTSLGTTKPLSTLTIFTDEKETGRPYGQIIDRLTFKNLASKGCSFCETPIEWGDHGIQFFLSESLILCANCSRTNHTQIHVSDIDNKVLQLARA